MSQQAALKSPVEHLSDEASAPTSGMSALEIRSSVILALLFALRMLGLFLILPVFAIYAKTLAGGDQAWLVGLALGMYGLTNAVGQIPLGIASDKFGRRPVILIGLTVFAIGAVIAALSDNIAWVIVGRALQGSGAISAAITAWIADATREEHRTKAMAMVGGSIGLTCALSMVAAPILFSAIGMQGIFLLTGVLPLLAILVVMFMLPKVAKQTLPRVPLSVVLKNTDLMRLNYGVFALHFSQAAMFVVVPSALVHYAGLPLAEHWKVYLPVVMASFVGMLPLIYVAEKYGKIKAVFIGAITLLLLVQLGFWEFLTQPAMLIALLFGFFLAFNVLEASQPSLVSRIAPPAAKGAALGIYNTIQSLGLFSGSMLGAWMSGHLGQSSVFVFSAFLCFAWLIIAFNMKKIPGRPHKAPSVISSSDTAISASTAVSN
jgi:MFS family permease